AADDSYPPPSPAPGAQPRQRIVPALALPLPVVDLHSWPAAQRDAEVRRRAEAEAHRPFDLAQGPLLRATVLRLGPEEPVGLLTMHHIVSDGWSTRGLMRELGLLYHAFCAGQPSPLPDLPVQYADYACWQRQWLAGEALEEQLAYWRQRLGGLAGASLPTDRPRPAVQTFRGARLGFGLSAAVGGGV